MTPLELALVYMDCLFETGDFDHLRTYLDDNLRFEGPLYRYESADDYINALKRDPPDNFSYKILKTWSDQSSACLVYQFTKPGISTTMAQVFETSGDKIKSIQLIFDASLSGLS